MSLASLTKETSNEEKDRILKFIEQSEGEIKLGAASFEVASVPPLDINLMNKE